MKYYLDHNSTTPTDPRVIDKMIPWYRDNFGNASSYTHAWGWKANVAVEHSRVQLSQILGCEPSELYFTNSATMAINIGIRGVYESNKQIGNHIISARTEHKATLNTLAYLETQGANVTYLEVQKDGKINIDDFLNAINQNTVMVVLMHANNETGVLQDIESIGEICKEKKLILFSDITQSVGKIHTDLKALKIGAAALSAHKFGGPMGVGALYLSRKAPRVTASPILFGGGQEAGLMPGTMNIPCIVGFGHAAELRKNELWDYGMHCSRLRTTTEQFLEYYCNAHINGSIKDRIPNTTNIVLPGCYTDKLIVKCPSIGISAGSACTSALPNPSHVLEAMGIAAKDIKSSIRISVGMDTTMDALLEALEVIKRAYQEITKE